MFAKNLIFLGTCSLASVIVQYDFYNNFGQIFLDYSGNGQSAVNGDSSTTTTKDTTATDRGAYFSTTESYVLMPKNDVVTSDYFFGSTFSMFFWVFPLDGSNYYIFYRKCTTCSNYFYLSRDYASNSLGFRMVFGTYDSGVASSGSNNFVLRKCYIVAWSLVFISMNPWYISIGINWSTYINISLPFQYYLEGTDEYLGYIGGFTDATATSLNGFMWGSILDNSLVSPTVYLYSYYVPGTCLYSQCQSSCSPAFYYNGAPACISITLDPLHNSAGTACVGCTNGCLGTTCLDCTCTSLSCTTSSGAVVCACPSGFTVVANGCVCISGILLAGGACLECYEECATCTTSSLCSSCIATNASPAAVQGCTCDTGYYGTSPLTSVGSCTACYVECATCIGAGICQTCKSLNASPSLTQGCTCAVGYFGVAPLDSANSCSNCYVECSSCSQVNKCTTCISANASPGTTEGCVCNPGYYGVAPLVTVGACLACYAECSTCTQYSLCLSCVSLQAVPVKSQGCVCSAGYYGTSPLIQVNSCGECYLECATCTDGKMCTTCLSKNASPNGTEGCNCNAGYYGTSPLVSSASCRECYLECATCTQENLCSVCISLNASPINTTGCACDLGYYGNSPLTESDSCVPCSTECIEYNITTGSCTACKACPPYCDTCDSVTCITCTDNAYLAGVTCKCRLGFFGSNACDPTFLTAVLTITNSNSLNLVFSSELDNDLNPSDIRITTCIPLAFVMEKWSSVRYFITLDIQVTVPANCTLHLAFLDPADILSTENAMISNGSLNIQLVEGTSEEVATALAIEEATTTSGKVTTATTATTFSVSMLNTNPACLWSFINTVQMICFIEMSNIPLPPKFSGYLAGLKKYNMFPNFFAYFVPESGGQVPFKKAYDFGYKTNLLLINSGNYLSAFFTMLALYLILFILSKLKNIKPFSIGFIKSKIEGSLVSYKYAAFIRFWITCYLDICAAALIAIVTTNHFTAYLSINLALAIIITVRYI